MAQVGPIRLPVEIEVSGQILRPGDKLLVNMGEVVTEQQRDELTRLIGSKLPGVEVLVFQARQLIVYQPGEIVHNGEVE